MQTFIYQFVVLTKINGLTLKRVEQKYLLRQQNSGAVEDFILPYSAVYLRIQK